MKIVKTVVMLIKVMVMYWGGVGVRFVICETFIDVQVEYLY